MNIAQQMKAQIAFNKALPSIQMQLSNKDYASVPYADGLLDMLKMEGFEANYNQREGEIFVSFKEDGGFWANR